MKFDITRVDVESYLASHTQPVLCVPRCNKPCRVPENHLHNEIKWIANIHGDFVRVPINGYLSQSSDLSWLIAQAIELAWRAVSSFDDETGALPSEIQLFMGSAVHVVDGKYQFYLGLICNV